MSKRALIVYGGWDSHEPDKVADLFAEILRAENYEVELSDTLETFADTEKVSAQNLIVPVWTMGDIKGEQREPVTKAVSELGVGIAGCHGGMCDSFRNDTEWQFMTGSQWVSHPGNDGTRYWVHMDRHNPHEITQGLPDFEVVSEQYYLHVDPLVNTLAYCHFPTPGVEGPHTQNPGRMPQVYTKWYGKGKVFYNALGHQRSTLEAPVPRELMRRGFLWATK